jgi:hypothetical protein
MTDRTGVPPPLRLLLVLTLAAFTVAVPGPGPAGEMLGETPGESIVSGRVYNLDRGEGVPINRAAITFRNLNRAGAGASGVAVSDVNGDFAFAIVVGSRDMVQLTAGATGFEVFTTSERADQLVGRDPAVEIGLGAPSPGRHRIRGQLVTGAGCALPAADVQVRLRRASLTTRSNASGAFHFDGLVDGDYIVRVGRQDLELPVTVAGQDQEVTFCLDCPELPTVSPDEARPGSTLRVEGPECAALRPKRLLTVYFDDALVASTETDSYGGFEVEVPVPRYATAGPHRVRVFTENAGEIASTQIEVEAGCPGDCDRDGEVTISEVLRGVALALGTPTLPCPAYGEPPVTIDELVRAVDGALNGCDAGEDD